MHPGGHVWNTLYTIRRKSEATFILSKTRREYSPFTNSISLSAVKGHGNRFPNCWWCGLLPRIFCGRFAKRAHIKWYSNGVHARVDRTLQSMLHQRDFISHIRTASGGEPTLRFTRILCQQIKTFVEQFSADKSESYTIHALQIRKYEPPGFSLYFP